MRNQLSFFRVPDGKAVANLDQIAAGAIPFKGQKVSFRDEDRKRPVSYRVSRVHKVLVQAEDETFQQIDVFLTPERAVR